MKIQNNKKAYLVLGLFVAILVSASSLGIVVAQTSVNTNTQNSPPVDGDQVMMDIEKDIPGFGGAFMDKNGVLNVYIVSDKASPTQTDSERSASLEKYLGKEHMSKGMIVVKGTYTFSELQAYKQKLTPLLNENMNLTAVGVDKAKNRIMIGVEKMNEAYLVTNELPKLNIPSEAVNIVETGKVTLDSHQLKHSPVTGGIQLEYTPDGVNLFACSVGMSADTTSHGRVTTTAGHCSISSNRDSTFYYQCCYATDGSNNFGGGISGTNPIQNRWSDSVLISPLVSTSKGVVHNDSGDVTLSGKQYVDVVGDSIKLSGRSSMDSSGTITQTCMNTLSPTYGTLFCQDYGTYAHTGGDSGGTVYGFDINSGTWKWYGTHVGDIGGSAEFSTVHDIENDQGTLTIN